MNAFAFSKKTSLETSTFSKIFWRDILLLLCIFVPLYMMLLGNRPFATPDEARYVEIPREMLFFNDWITPHLNGVKYFEKPPLLYWIYAIIQSIFGSSEYVMRMPIAFFGWFGILGTYAFAQRIFNRKVGLISAAILGTTGLWFALSHLIILDMAISVFMTLALFTFYSAIMESPSTYKRRSYLAATAVLCALGVLTKGIIMLAVFGMTTILWLIITRQYKRLFPLYLPTNLFIFLLIAAPWHILAALKNPEFLYKYFVVEHFLRYTTTIHGRYQPMWFFIPIFIAGFLPWTGFLIAAVRDFWKDLVVSKEQKHHASDRDPLLFLIIWPLFILSFFSFSNSKLIPYILPVFPPLSILTGHWIAKKLSLPEGCYKWRDALPTVILSAFVWITILIVLIPFVSRTFGIEEIIDNASTFLCPLFYFGSSFLAMACLSVPSLKMHLKTRLITIGILMMTNLMLLSGIAPFIQKPSMKPLVNHMLLHKNPKDTVTSYLCYHQDLPLYARQIVNLVGFEGELQFGIHAEPHKTKEWNMDVNGFSAYLDHYPQTQLIHGKEIPVTHWIFTHSEHVDAFIARHPQFQCAIGQTNRHFCVLSCRFKPGLSKNLLKK